MTNPTSTTEPTVETYLDAVRQELRFHPAIDVDEVLDDLAVHLEEVAGEGDLLTELGRPADYAREFLRSAGIEPASRGGWLTSVGGVADRTFATVQTTFREFQPELRPTWWVLRAYVAVLLVSAATVGLEWRDLPWPSPAGNELLGVVAVGLAVVWSIRLGRRAQVTPPTGGRRRLVAVANTVLAVWGVWAATQAPSFASSEVAEVDGPFGAAPGEHAVDGPSRIGSNAFSDDGQAVIHGLSNVYAYTADGVPLTDVLLFDQDGRPVVLSEEQLRNEFGWPYVVTYDLDANGRAIRNRYPLDLIVPAEFDEEGLARPVQPPTVVVPPAAPPATTAPPETVPAPTTAPPDAAPTTTIASPAG